MVLDDQSLNSTDLLSLGDLKLTTPSIYLTKGIHFIPIDLWIFKGRFDCVRKLLKSP